MHKLLGMINYEAILSEIAEEIVPYLSLGKVADYIPALANADLNQFAMSITLFDGTTYNIGDFNTRFSIQSISKVFTFTKSLNIHSAELYNRVGKEPSGNPFNSLVQLEYEKGKPRNPFINAGAIVITDTLISHYKSTEATFENTLNFIQSIAHNKTIDFDSEVYESEYKTSFRNLALANLMKSFGNLDNSVDDVVKTYLKHCSIAMSTKELSRAMLFLANHGTDPISQQNFITPSQAKRINALMLTCGHYDASGEFAFYVGLPGKSGVGGGIVAVVPNMMSIAVFSPGLNSWGNSLAGTHALQLFTSKSGLSIF